MFRASYKAQELSATEVYDKAEKVKCVHMHRYCLKEAQSLWNLQSWITTFTTKS